MRNAQTGARTDIQTVTCRTTVELAGLKTGGLSFMSETSMLTVTVEDMAGEPLSKACTVKEYLGTYMETKRVTSHQSLYCGPGVGLCL